MINILSYVGMNMQSEVCLWCLLGLVRTIFDATLFKVNANLKQVWQMTMPEELTMPVQRVLRTMVSGVMLVQCFTVYVYLATYIVLLYPVFLEERPTLVLPWLLMAAVRKLLCELTSLALGLGTCLLLGPARSPCIKFVVVKFTSIIPAFYMWLLVFSYYHALKVATAFKTFPTVLPANDNDYGLELAVRRRRTKSLLGEAQLRKKLVANFYGERTASATNETYLHSRALEISSRIVNSADTSVEEEEPDEDVMKPSNISTTRWSDIGAYEDWFGSEVMIPRDTDRILEQIVLMLLRIGAYLKKEGIESIIDSQKLNSAVPASWHQRDNIDCTAMNVDNTDTPPNVGSSKGNVASYLREYPQIFMKKQGISQTELKLASLKTVHSLVETDKGYTSNNKVKHNSPSITSYEANSLVEVEKVPSKTKITVSDTTAEDKTVQLTLPSLLQTKQTANEDDKKIKSKLKKQRDSERLSKNASENINKIQDDLLESKTFADVNKKASSESKKSNKIKNNDFAETLNNNNTKITHFEISNADNSKISSEDKTRKGNHNEEFSYGQISIVEESLIQSKLLNIDNSREASDVTIFNETTNDEFALSHILNVENNEMLNKSGIENKFKYRGVNDGKTSKKASYDTILKENFNQESTLSQILNVTNQEEFTLSRISNEDYNKNLTLSRKISEFKYNSSNDSIIPKEGVVSKDDNNKGLRYDHHPNCSRIKEPPDVNILNENSNTNLNDYINEIINDTLNVSKNKKLTQKNESKNEFTHSQIKKSINDKNKELPLRLLSNDDNIIDSLDVKISIIDDKREVVQSNTLSEDNNNELIHKEILNKELAHNQISTDDRDKEFMDSTVPNEGKNKVSLDIKKSDEVKNKDSTDGKLLNQVNSNNSTETNPECNSKESVAENGNKLEKNT